MMEMNNSKVHNRVTLREVGSQMRGADFISLPHTCIQGELQLGWKCDAHALDQLVNDREHTVLYVKIKGVPQKMS
jgi:hypothetical protein